VSISREGREEEVVNENNKLREREEKGSCLSIQTLEGYWV